MTDVSTTRANHHSALWRRIWNCRVLYLLILPLIVGIDGVWAAVIAAEALALVLSAACLVRNRKKYGYA